MKFLFALLLLCSGSVVFSADQLTLYILPSPMGIDWKSPKDLILSSIKNRIQGSDRFLGHVFVELQCGEKRELTAMNSKKFDYLRQLLWENRGPGILFHSFEGRLENKSEIEGELDARLKAGEINFTRFLLNAGHCARLTQYLKEYRGHNVDRYYGLANRPLYGEGASSAAFGVSFLEVAEIMDEEMKDHWGNIVSVPLDSEVSIVKILISGDAWAPENAPHRKLFFWDPDRMYQWVRQMLTKPLPQRMKSIDIEKTHGIVMDMTTRPAPERPIWLQHTDPIYRKN